jgi:PAT family beta-lactamase induction signal transducer AmpG
MAIVFLLGFSSGLPYMLCGDTLGQWIYDETKSKDAVAAIASAALPYNFKYLWAPLVDRYRLPFLGRRRGWMIVFQIALFAALVAASTLDASDPSSTWWYALFIAIAAASQDIVIDAYNADLFEPHERAAGTAAYVTGFRVAMLVSGSLALIVADDVSWRAIYLGMAALVAIGIGATLLAEEPPERDRPPRTLVGAFVIPLDEFFRRLGWGALLVLAFVATYKLGDQFAQKLTGAFYREIGFSKKEIGVISKAIGFAAVVVGGALAGGLVARYGIRKMLLAFGIVQATVHLCYLWMAVAGKNLWIYGVTNCIENVGFAMGTSALTAAVMGMTSPSVSATQMALLTSLTTLLGRLFGPYSSDVQAAVGWESFFLITMAMALPGIVLSWLARRFIDRKTP